MQPDPQKDEIPQSPASNEVPEFTPPTITESKPADVTPFALPKVPIKKSRKGLIIGIAVVMVLAVAGSAAAYVMMQNKGVANTGIQQVDGIAVPKGWKNFTSDKFGVSFITPEKWSVNEVNQQVVDTGVNGVIGHTISISNPDDDSGMFAIRISKGRLADVVSEHIQGTSSTDGYDIATKSVKWRNNDAVELSSEFKGTDGKVLTIRFLYVEISDYVFIIPHRDDVPNSVKEGIITKDTYSTFVDSIRIDNKAV